MTAQGALGYEFFGQGPAIDSVRLVLNQTESAEDVISLDVMVTGVPAIDTAAFDIDFDRSVIEWEGRHTNDPDGFLEGDFFGGSSWTAVGNEIMVDGNPNRSKVIVGVIGDIENPVSGSGRIITVKFRIVGIGSSPMAFSGNSLVMQDGNFTSTAWFGGTLQVDEMPGHSSPQDDPPFVDLEYPGPYEVISEEDVEVTCSASDDLGLVNMTLYTNMTGSWDAFGSVETPEKQWMQSFALAGLSSGTYRWNCLAYDYSSQSSWASQDMSFTVSLPADYTPPVISGVQVTGNGTGSPVSISMITDEAADCRYSAAPGMPFNAMKDGFSGNGTLSHSVNLTLPADHRYMYHMKCRDAQGNANEEDYEIPFPVGTPPADSTAPSILGFSPEVNLGYGTRMTVIEISTDEPAECRISDSPGTDFSSMEPFPGAWTRNHTYIVTGLTEGVNHTFFVKCRDIGGNINTDTQMTFFVCFEADSDCSRGVSLAELNSFINRWYRDSRDITMRRVMEAIGLWKTGTG